MLLAKSPTCADHPLGPPSGPQLVLAGHHSQSPDHSWCATETLDPHPNTKHWEKHCSALRPSPLRPASSVSTTVVPGVLAPRQNKLPPRTPPFHSPPWFHLYWKWKWKLDWNLSHLLHYGCHQNHCSQFHGLKLYHLHFGSNSLFILLQWGKSSKLVKSCLLFL